MFINPGLKVENDLIEALNNKKISEISNNLKHLILHIFDNVNLNATIMAEHCDPRGKPDIKLIIENETHYLSVKSGQSKSIHCEEINKFIKFLSDSEVSQETIDTILLYQYGDGTTDGSGKERLGYDDLFPFLVKRIKKANEELNEYNDFLLRFIDRVLFKGNFPDLPAADCIYHGNVEYGVACTKKQIIKHLRKKNYDYMHNLHIGPVQFRPYARYVDFIERNPGKRSITQFGWVNLNADLMYISERYL